MTPFKRGLFTLAILLLGEGAAHAQLAAFSGRAETPISVQSPRGAVVMGPISYGQVRVCSTPASGSPCTPVATIFDNNGNTLSVAGGNFGQLTTDVTGFFSGQCNPGTYQIQVAASASNTPQVTYLLSCPVTTSPGFQGPATITGPITFSGAVTFNAGLTTTTTSSTGAGTHSGTETFKNSNAILYVDGTANTYTTIQAALAAVPATGAEVHVTPGSTATWSGGAIPANTKLIFDSAATTYAVTAPVTLGVQSHIICSAGQSPGPAGANNSGFPNAGTVLNFTGSLTGSQDAISATGSNNNDGVSVEGCTIRMGGSGRAGIHFSGINGSQFKNSVVTDPGSYCWWLDAGSTAGSHSYGNYVQQTDCIHPGLEAYRLSTDPAGTGVGGDIDRTTMIDAEQHPRDIGGVSSSGFGWHLLVPSTAGTAQSIGNTKCIACISNGTQNNGYGLKLEVGVAAPAQGYILDTRFEEAELEDVFQANTGTALLISDNGSAAISHLSVAGGLVGPGYTTNNNVNAPVLNVVDFFFSNGTTNLNSNFVNIFDAISFVNNYTATAACANGGVRFGTSVPILEFQMTNDSILHAFRCDTTTDQFKWDVSNTAFVPSTDNTWDFGGGVPGQRWRSGKFAGSVRGSQAIADQGTACTNGELALSAGWQSTGAATVTAVAGNGQTCSWTITTGTTTAANPTVTDTLTNALPTATTVCEMNIHGGTHTFPAAGEYFQQTTLSATAPVFTANFTPSAGGTTYFVTRRCGP
jgi:hypothetical protein